LQIGRVTDASEFFWIGPATPQIRSHERDVADEVEGIEADDPARSDLAIAATGSRKIC
jgi:hypothetical protein